MYETFYNMSLTPFSSTPDPHFFYTGPSHREALAALVYGINHRKGFIALIGEVGTGKTTVLRSYIHSKFAKDLKLIYIFNPKLDFDSFLTMVLREFGREIPDTEIEKADLLHRYLVACYERNQNVVLVVDEAQNMPQETLESLRMLSNIETTRDKLIQIVLAGQPELESILASHSLRQLRQRLALTVRLRPLSPGESRDYLLHRVSRAGAEQSPFTEESIDWVVKRANGIPRNINVICDNALVTGYGYGRIPIDLDVMREIEADLRLENIDSSLDVDQGVELPDAAQAENQFENQPEDDEDIPLARSVGNRFAASVEVGENEKREYPSEQVVIELNKDELNKDELNKDESDRPEGPTSDIEASGTEEEEVSRERIKEEVLEWFAALDVKDKAFDLDQQPRIVTKKRDDFDSFESIENDAESTGVESNEFESSNGSGVDISSQRPSYKPLEEQRTDHSTVDDDNYIEVPYLDDSDEDESETDEHPTTWESANPKEKVEAELTEIGRLDTHTEMPQTEYPTREPDRLINRSDSRIDHVIDPVSYVLEKQRQGVMRESVKRNKRKKGFFGW